jgi:hypothetical protein
MRFPTVTSAIRGISWRTRYKRGFDAGALTLFLGPPLGGLAFGIVGDVNHIILAARGQGPPTTFVEPITTALWAFFMPRAWLAAATAALYVVARVEITGRTWAETILLAVICSVLTGRTYQNDFFSASLGSALVFLTCALCAVLAPAVPGWPIGTGSLELNSLTARGHSQALQSVWGIC